MKKSPLLGTAKKQRIMSTSRNLAGRNTRRSFSGIAWLPLALCLIGSSPTGAAAQGAADQTATLVLSGDVAPDGNGTFLFFSPVPTLNATGEVAFVAELAGTQSPSTDASGIFVVDTQSINQLVRTGEPAPDGNGVFNFFAPEFGNLERVALNDNGRVAFTGKLSGTTGGTTDNLGLFGADAVGGVTQFVRFSDAAPNGNGIFGIALSPPGLDNLGRASFHGVLTGTSGGDGEGAFRSDGSTVTRLVRAGETVPEGDTTFSRIFAELGSNLGGQVAIETSRHPIGGPSGFEGTNRIYVSTGAILEEVVRIDVSIADGNGTLGSFEGLGIADNGHVVFRGSVTNTDNFTDGIRLFLTDGMTLTQIAAQDKIGPGENQTPPFRFASFAGLDSSNHDKVAFSAVLERNVAPPDHRTSGIYLGDGSSITLIVHQGDTAPGGNGTFGDLAVPVLMNNSGEIAFQALLEGTDDPPSDTQGIFFIDTTSNVQEVARSGQPLAGSTIAGASFLGSGFPLDDSDLRLAGMNGINDSGQVAFQAGLADGRWGVFLWSAASNVVFAGGFESGDTSAWSAEAP